VHAPTTAGTTSAIATTPTVAPPAAPAVATEPEPLDVLRPIATPWPAHAIHLGEVEDDYLVALFPEERAALRREIAAWLEAHGETMIPVAELERVEARGALAELALEGDRKCRAPLAARRRPSTLAGWTTTRIDRSRVRRRAGLPPAGEHRRPRRRVARLRERACAQARGSQSVARSSSIAS
jgi:hypothetical protein